MHLENDSRFIFSSELTFMINERLRHMIAGSMLEPLDYLFDWNYLSSIKEGDFPKWLKLVNAMPIIEAELIDLGEEVTIGRASDAPKTVRSKVEAQLQKFIPWRKGPFNLFGIRIDSEWRGELKWQRMVDEISPLNGRNVLDVGSGNGYFGYRMIEAGASSVIGLEPHLAYVAQAWVLSHFAPSINNFILPIPLSKLPNPCRYFDTVFSMGVLYHRRSPIDHIFELRQALKPGGELVLETIYVDGPEGYCLTPKETYARMRNIWFLPTILTIKNWLSRAAFSDVQIIDESPTTVLEQRATTWMPYASLQDGLHDRDSNITREGYPAQRRVVITARN